MKDNFESDEDENEYEKVMIELEKILPQEQYNLLQRSSEE